jgi:hypothetical protein
MVVEGLDLFDLREEMLVDLLHVGTGEWTGLRGGESCQTDCGAG